MNVPGILFFLVSLATFDFSGKRVRVIPLIAEASGIADSKAFPGYLWAHEDSGHPPELYLVGYDGRVVRKVYLKGALNRDWEDMALAGGDLYVADIGDNNRQYQEHVIYRFTEPPAAADTIDSFHTIRFRYPDGPHNAEAFLVDPQTRDIFIITKHDRPSRIYQLAFPYSLTAVNSVRPAGKLPYRGVVGAALSPDGKRVIIKTYFGLYHYCREEGESIAEALGSDFTKIPYLPEPQGEAITFALCGNGFYTLSEKGWAKKVRLRYNTPVLTKDCCR